VVEQLIRNQQVGGSSPLAGTRKSSTRQWLSLSNFEGDQEFLQSKFREKIVISPWRDGLSFNVATEGQFEDLVKWLKLEGS
jgi:hypothetical protein